MAGVDEECNSALSKALNKHDYSIRKGNGCFNAGTGELRCNTNQLKDTENSYYVKGGVFYHESGHLIDYSEGDRWNNYTPLSTSFMSAKHDMTLIDMVRQEGREVDWYAIKQEYQEELSEKIKDLQAQNDTLMNKINQEVEAKSNVPGSKELQRRYYNDEIDSVEYNREWHEKIQPLLEPHEKEIERLRAEYNSNWNKIQQEKAKLAGKWGDISDICDGATGTTINGMGHGYKYWRTRPRARGTEFFAECFQAKAVNPESMELIKKHFPKSYEIFEEILRSR